MRAFSSWRKAFRCAYAKRPANSLGAEINTMQPLHRRVAASHAGLAYREAPWCCQPESFSSTLPIAGVCLALYRVSRVATDKYYQNALSESYWGKKVVYIGALVSSLVEIGVAKISSGVWWRSKMWDVCDVQDASILVCRTHTHCVE